MINSVTKRDGTVVPFDADKLNKWAEYATGIGGNWSDIALKTFKRLEDKVSTKDVHETMIQVCLAKEDISHSRVAARLIHATLKKNMEYLLELKESDSFERVFTVLTETGVWDEDSLPEYNPLWEGLYSRYKNQKLEYWQLRQWADKYSLQIQGLPVETPVIGFFGIALALHGDNEKAYTLFKGLCESKINLPTPVLNGCRNGDFDTISCCVIKGGDTIDSIGVAEHISYKQTAKKSGIGIMMDTRSKGEDVKGGRVKHLGKHGIYQTVDRAIKMFTQVSRGGSATMTYTCIDPQVEEMLLWKTQRVDIEERIDKMDYSLSYNDAFLQAVIKDSEWCLFDLNRSPDIYESYYRDSVEEYLSLVENKKTEATKIIKARDLLKSFLTCRQETGRVYCINVSRANTHTPFTDTIYQSNLCQEIALPTKPYEDMFDLYAKDKSKGETAFCCLSAINVTNVTDYKDYEDVAEICVRTADRLIDLAPAMTPSMEESIKRRRSLGIGITGLAGYLYGKGLDYDGSEESIKAVSELAETHYYTLLKASQEMAKEEDCCVQGVDLSWLPVDTRINDTNLIFDWEKLRGLPRKHSVLVAHMPTESSALLSNATNGLYPVRKRVINKSSRKGVVQYIAPEGAYKLAWDIDNNDLAKYYSLCQDMTDQAISADYYVNFTKYPDGKVPISQLMKEFVVQAKLGNKTMYYVNSNDDNGGSFQDVVENKEDDEVVCEGCTI